MGYRPSRFRIAVLVLLVALAAFETKVGEPTLTGDETHYALAALRIDALLGHRTLASEWTRFLDRSSLARRAYPFAGFASPGIAQSTLLPLVLAPAIPFGLGVARWFTFFIACVGLGAVAATTRSAVSLAIVSFSFPLVAYVRLLYPEALLFALVAVALRSFLARRAYLTACLAAVLPLVHARAIPLSLAFAASIVIDAARDRTRRSLAYRAVAIYGAIVALFAVAERLCPSAFGSTGFATYGPALDTLWLRAGMQSFDVRHGLLVYAPIFAFGVAGLVAGAIARNRACAYASALLIAYAATFVWATASESFAARYWVAALPFLAVGLAFWVERIHNRATLALALPAVAIGVLNAALFADHADWFLENRRASLTYAIVYKLTHVHLGLYLPIDRDALDLPGYDATLPFLMLGACALVVALVFVVAARDVRGRRAATVAAAFITTAPLAASVYGDVPSDRYAVAVRADGTAMDLAFREPHAPVRAIQLDDLLPVYWDVATFPNHFTLACRGEGGAATAFDVPSRAVLLAGPCARAPSVTVTAIGARVRVFARAPQITVIRSIWST